MPLLVSLRLTDGVQKMTHPPCVGHRISEVESPSGKAWKMIYGWWGVALHETRDELMGWSPLGKESFSSRKLRTTTISDKQAWQFIPAKLHGRLQGSSTFPGFEAKRQLWCGRKPASIVSWETWLQVPALPLATWPLFLQK